MSLSTQGLVSQRAKKLTMKKKHHNKNNRIDTGTCTSNGGCRREEKSRKHWSLFTKLLSLVAANLFFPIRSNQPQLYVLIALKNREK